MTQTDLKTILVVDDSALDRKLLKGLLEKRKDWRVECVSDGGQAVEAIERASPDLIVTDLQMPNVDGLGLVKHVKQNWPNLPIVLVTGVGSEQIAIEALRAGAACFSPKSLLQRDLARTVDFVLQVSNYTSRATAAHAVSQPYRSGFVLENDCRLIGPLIEHLQNQMPHWSDDQRLQIGMALGEALINAMHHGNLEVESSLRVGDESEYHAALRARRSTAPWSERRVHVEAQFDREQIEIRIADEGPGFRPDEVPDPTAEENLEKLSGRGLLLIRSFMDDVVHNGRGNEIRMVKRRS